MWRSHRFDFYITRLPTCYGCGRQMSYTKNLRVTIIRRSYFLARKPEGLNDQSNVV